MSDKKKSTNEKWKGMSPKEFFAKLPRETLRMKIDRLYQKIKRKCNSSNRTTIRGWRGHVCGGNIPHQEPATPTFREKYRVDHTTMTTSDIERHGLREAAADAYLDSLPGYED